MDVLLFLARHQIDNLTPKDMELFTYFAYKYGIENDTENHPIFYIRLFTKINRLPIINFKISHNGRIDYNCEICREKKPCRHFDILVTKIYQNEYEQIKMLSEKFLYEISDIERREQQNKFDASLDGVFKEMYKEEIASTSSKARIRIYLEDTRWSYVINATVGKTKEYKIASIDRFYRFNEEEEFRYGKDLTLIHNLSSFDEASQKLLNPTKYNPNFFVDLRTKALNPT